ncbi:MAG TPA: hypothetical protein VE862_00735 [Candidatus Acidoferrum sp.]|nr:hypothetical protein [Candidatus Acidoferrum sp.]
MKRKYAIVLLILFASLVSTLPTITLADQQSQLGTTTISLSGQAIPFDTGSGTGPPTSATLNLAGEVQRTGDNEFNIQNLTGSLQIGSTSYTVYNGQGSASQDGTVWITATTNSNVDDHQLVLNGSVQGNALTFLAPSSRLTTQFFLALNGDITMNDEQGSSMVGNAVMNSNGSNASYTPLANTTLTQNSTILENMTTSSVNNTTEATNATQTLNNMTMVQFTNQTIPSIANTTLAQNSTAFQNPIGSSVNYNVTTVAIQMPNNNTTVPQYSNESNTTNPIMTQNSTELQNATTTSANNVTTVAMQVLNNVTTTQFTNQSISSAPSAPPQIVTVTVTQPQYNQTTTVYATQTVANSTITQTVTGNESNVTITQSNVTITTVANVTVTVTNSTATSTT